MTLLQLVALVCGVVALLIVGAWCLVRTIDRDTEGY